ncbi:MAG TPA: serine--tRNA ligase [Candidatus Omnitrophota bacterium]|nr:serine--tRNA ligase [Candidatus Omnitrophota bacterium]
MLDLKFVREHAEAVRKGLKDKGYTLDITPLLSLDEQRRQLLQEVEALKCERNKANDEISGLKRSGGDPAAKIAEMKSISQKIGNLDSKVDEIVEKIADFSLRIPNMPHISVPIGGATEAKIVKEWGEKPVFDFMPKTHLEIGEKAGFFSFDQAGKISGSGFPLYKGTGAKLERALINFMLDLHTEKHGYTEIFPPFLVTRQSMTGTGQLPNLEEDMYRLKDEDMFLIPTAEVPVTNIHRDEILEEDKLPVKYAAYTACFRREAGSYGKDTRGLTRVHQFNKVELVKLAHPEKSFDELESLREDAEEVLRLLGIPYRVLLLPSGDMSFAAAKCYDLEAWSPGTGKWLEVSSCSCFTDFQARRINIRYRPKGGGKPAYVHTLNASGIALPRTMIATLENFQKKDGTIEIPAVLKPYLD